MHQIPFLQRRSTLAWLATSAAALGLSASAAAQVARAPAAQVALGIGYQKAGAPIILKEEGALEARLAAQAQVKWTEFPAGPVLLEGLNVGSIQFGTAGETPPIFAQAAGADMVYVATGPTRAHSEAVVVPPGSDAGTVADLRGKRVALNRGSNVHYFWLRALERAGLAWKDVQTVYLAPADARAAFERGNLDAWVIWDPYLAAAEKQMGARILQNAGGLVPNRNFYLAQRQFAERHADVIAAILQEIDRVERWIDAHRAEYAAILSRHTGLDLEVTQHAAQRHGPGVLPMTEEVVADQQKIADAFFALKLIPKSIRVLEAVPDVKRSSEKI